MTAKDHADTLSADASLRLADFARACKAAARMVALYPATHPAIQSSLSRVADTAQRLRGTGTATVTVMPDALLLDGRGAGKPDASLAELSALLHTHLIGELTVHGDLTREAWHTFLTLLARSPEDIRAQGGFSRAWMAAGGGGAIEIRQIDYADVLREREDGVEADWDDIIQNCLDGDLSKLDKDTLEALLVIASDNTDRFKEFTEKLVTRSSEGQGKRDAVLSVLQALANYVAQHHPEKLNAVLNQIASVIPRLTPDLVVTLITTGVPKADGAAPGIDLPDEVRSRLSDHTIAEFVAQSVSRDQGATARLAQAFQTLVPEEDKRAQLLAMAHEQAAAMPVGQKPDFPELWKSAENLLTTYSDSNFVSDEYGRELATARKHAVEVERVSDDPPERIRAWLSTVSETEIRRLDQQVLRDLIAIEKRADAWQHVLDSAVTSVAQLVLSGQLMLAQQLVDAIVAAAQENAPFAQAANAGLDRIRTGPVMRHVVSFIRQAREDEVKALSHLCQTLGPSVIGPLAEALAIEQGLALRRLREIVLSFGAAGRAYADQLRASANPAVRRTAIELLRTFGGAEALPELAKMLGDAELAVQREALRAIVQIGTDEAYETLGQALKTSTPRTRDAIMQVLSASRDERAVPLFVYILQHTNYRGDLESVYLSAIEALGNFSGDAESVAVLKTVLYRGEWWAPGRTARLRVTAATALRACGSAAAQQVLEEAVSRGPRGVRRAVLAALAMPAPRLATRRTT
jgi:hypothetical protein